MSYTVRESNGDAHDDTVASLLLEEIDLLDLATFDSSAETTLDTACLSPNYKTLPEDGDHLITLTTATGVRFQQVNSQTSIPEPYLWEDSLVLSDDAPLCGDLPEDFDLLSYADAPGDRSPQHDQETMMNFYDSFEDTVNSNSTLDLRCLSPVSDLSESETCFTKLKPRPKYTKDVDDESHDLTRQPPLKMQSRRDAGEPKRPKNGFIRYSIKHRAELLKLYPYKDNRTISKLLGIRWKNMTAEEKQPYVDEFNNDIHEIRASNPKWRYAPAKRSAEELIDPMSKRLRPRDKIRSKMWSRDKEWEWGFSTDDSNQSQSSSEGRHSPLQHSATSWKQCDLCNLWRPLPGHVNSEDLPETWCCYMNPDSRFNRCWTAIAPAPAPPVYSSHCLALPHQPTYSVAPSNQPSVLFLLPSVHSTASSLTSGVLVSNTTSL